MDALNRKRVVVTGVGVISALGQDVQTFFSNLVAGKSGIRRVDSFDVHDLASQIGGQVLDFQAEAHMDVKEVRRNDRYTHFAVAAARQAYTQAGLDRSSLDKDRVGVIIGSGIGGMATIEEQSYRLVQGGPRKVSPFMIPSLIANIASGVVAIELGVRGPNFGVLSACATATHAIGESLRLLRYGDADVMLAGGSEAAVTRLGYAGFCALKAMSSAFNHAPERASRPFDKDRDGFVMGEGAGVLVLETLAHAQARGAPILCELVGYGASCDAYHITAPDPQGAGLCVCLKKGLEDAGLQPDAVDYINAHGTSTPYNDKYETLALKNVFGSHAYQAKISSTKSMTGHLLGAAGAIESAVCVQTIQTGKIPPTINYETPDPDCDLDYTANHAQSKKVRVALNINLGFGGQNACLFFKGLD